MAVYTHCFNTMNAIKTSSISPSPGLGCPEFTRQRDLLDSAFTPEVVEGMRLMIHGVVDRALDEISRKYVAPGKSFDLIEQFAAPVPMQIAYKVLGVPETDTGRLSSQDERSLKAYVDDMVDERITEPSGRESSDLISRLAREQYRKGLMSRDDIVELALLVLGAGHTALVNSIGLGVLTLFQHPDQWAKVRRNPLAWAPSVVHECLRYNSVSSSPMSSAPSSLVAAEEQPPPITQAAGNQNWNYYHCQPSDPGMFDIRRNGYGPPERESEHLSRLELEIALGTLFARFPGLRLDSTAIIDDNTTTMSPIQSPTQGSTTAVAKLPVLVDTDAEMHRIIIACD
ncbi:cytochrome P450 [Biscogniauxia mediterranea]|nr:cytochrome P450 [Biscogniauxia mediterranea]